MSSSEQSNPEERWLPVPGYEGYYEVSDLGRVRSLDRFIDGRPNQRYFRKGQMLTRYYDPFGYPNAHLHKHGRSRSILVHRLVLEAFVGPRPEGMVTRHLNGEPPDDRLVNLVYGTQSENMADRFKHGKGTPRTHCIRGHEFTPENTWINNKGNRQCRPCGIDRTRRLRAAKKAAA